jgi:carboxyl-terminal processing protease
MLIRWLLGCCFLLLCSPALIAASNGINSDDDYQSLEILADVLSLVQHNYVDEVSLDHMVSGAVRGVIESLDPHSNYMSPEVYIDFLADTQGEFAGVGIELTMRNSELVVVAPIENTPAWRAGILPGDHIVAIDGLRTSDLDMLEAVKLMRGAAGETVTLTIKRKNRFELLEVPLTRELVRVESVRSQLFDDRYGYLRISQFQEYTGREVEKHLQQLRSQATSFSGLIIDMRNNPGGLLEEAIAVADLFLDSGLIVSTAGRQDADREIFYAHPNDGEERFPLIILINGGSASAAEIVAGALQDHNRGLVLGDQSFGKGSVQSIIELSDGSALRLTTAHYYTPSGRSIQARGITPDILSPQASLTMESVPNIARERDLDRHLHLEDTGSGTESETGSQPSVLIDDYQLQRALDLVKGASRFTEKNWSLPPATAVE